MATRQSLRLLGIGPELPPFHDKCFTCQLDLDIQSIQRCHVMPCCGKFLHKRCFKKARETSFQCGHCRVVGDDETSNSTESVENELRADEALDESRLGHPSRITRTHSHRKGQKRHRRFEKQRLCSHPSSTRDAFLATSSFPH